MTVVVEVLDRTFGQRLDTVYAGSLHHANAIKRDLEEQYRKSPPSRGDLHAKSRLDQLSVRVVTYSDAD